MTHNYCDEALAAAGVKTATTNKQPSAPPEAAVGLYPDLLNEVLAFTGDFVAYPSNAAHVAHVLWIAHTHLMDAWESTPRLAFLSPEPASGKTRALEVSELLVPNPVEAINVTPAYLFRKVGDDNAKPTILFDEIDTVFGPKAKENEEIRGLLNAGHRRGATAGRCVVHGKTVTTEDIPAYCAVALAGLGWLPDTILTRSVIIRMRRRAPHEKVTPFRRRVHAPTGLALRRQLAAWGKTLVTDMTAARPEMPPGIEDRDADIWEPLLAIADAAGGAWGEQARAAAIALVAVSRDAEHSLGIRLLADLRIVFGDRTSMSSKLILVELARLEEAPWGDIKGKPLDERGLSRRLAQYGIKPKKVREDGVPKQGYTRDDLYDAWIRYLPPRPQADKSGTSGTPGTTHHIKGENVPDEAKSIRNTNGTSGTGQGNVPDVPDDPGSVPDTGSRKKPYKSTDVPPVPDVPDLRGCAREYPACCEHCGGDHGEVVAWPIDGRDVWLHVACSSEWNPPATAAEPVPEANGAPQGMPFAMTRLMRERLRSAGYSAQDIHNMTPGQAHEALTRSSAATTAPVRYARNTDDIEF
jgi:hypothetical protein